MCDFCKNPDEARAALELFKGDVIGNKQAGRHQGRTLMVVDDGGDGMYGGGRKGVKT